MKRARSVLLLWSCCACHGTVGARPTSIAEGAPLSISGGSHTHDFALAQLRSGKAVLCQQGFQSNYTSCNVLMADGYAPPAKGDDTLIPAAASEFAQGAFDPLSYRVIALCQIDRDKALLCYSMLQPGQTSARPDYADCSCRVLSSSGMALSLGSAITVGQQAMDLTLTQLQSNKAILCFRSVLGTSSCIVLAASGTTLVPGMAELTVGRGVGQFVFLTLARLDQDKAVLCFTDFASTGKCSVLTVNGTAIAEGADITVSARVTSLSLAQLTDDKALLCYRNLDVVEGAPMRYRSRCNVLTTNGTSLAMHTELVMSEGVRASDNFTLAHLETDKVAACYQDYAPHPQSEGHCFLLMANRTELVQGPVVTVHGASLASRLGLARLDSERNLVCHFEDSGVGASSGLCRSLLPSTTTTTTRLEVAESSRCVPCIHFIAAVVMAAVVAG